MLEADFTVERRDFAVSVALRVAPGERLALFGPSGAGKTTVLETIAGLVHPRRGRVSLGGRLLATTEPARSVPTWRRRIGLLRHDPALFPHLSVAANLAYGAADRSSVAALASRLRIGELLAASPLALSAGQRRRVALARLLAAAPAALALDEPYDGLDEEAKRVVSEVILEAAAERQLPTLVAAHDLAEAQFVADRVAVIDRGQVLQVDEPAALVRAPATRRVAALVGYRSFAPLAGGGCFLAVHPDLVLLGHHPERGPTLIGELRSLRPSGARFELAVAVHGTAVTLRVDEPPAGNEIRFTPIAPPVYGEDGRLLASEAVPS
ncbi:MAG TPA: ATP-binding cassette domain-containing protein [Acidimicrobiales bacterium]|nr:ATP-binding cassette domain-containing protein [Acidimicrobiales bacterium]